MSNFRKSGQNDSRIDLAVPTEFLIKFAAPLCDSE